MKNQSKQVVVKLVSVVSSALFLLWLILFVQEGYEATLNTAKSHDNTTGDTEVSKQAVKPYSQQELQCLEEALFMEIRSGTTEAMKNVAYVILNRKEAKGFPDTICKVVKQPKQFSYLNNFTPAPDWQKRVLSKDTPDKQALLKVKRVAKKVLKEGSKDKTILWYATVDTKKNWMKNMKVQYNDGYHKHYAMK